MNIGIIFGGKSFEHDISIITTNVIYHALKEKYNIFLLYINRKGDFKIAKQMVVSDFIDETKLKDFAFIKNGIKYGFKNIKLDLIINAMHGINGEDGLASVVANLYDIPFLGSNHISSGLLMDKHFSYAVLRSSGIKVLKTKYLLVDNENPVLYEFPLIIKPARLGSSIGINVVEDEKCFKEICLNSFTYDSKLVVQPFISSFRELNQAAYFYNNEIFLSNVEEVFKTKEFLSFEDKYIESKIEKNKHFLTDKSLIEKISLITKKVYKLFELSGVIRIDYMLVDNELYVNEINTTPGSLAYYLFDDSYEFYDRIIYQALKNYQNKRKTNFVSSVLSQKNMYKK